MINDNQRHEVAQKLRTLACTPDEIGITEHGVIRDLGISAGIYDDSCRSEDVLAIVDLIDRPTATASMDYEAMEDGVPDFRIWTCHRCNESFPVYRGFSPAYCQNCGAEIVDD